MEIFEVLFQILRCSWSCFLIGLRPRSLLKSELSLLLQWYYAKYKFKIKEYAWFQS